MKLNKLRNKSNLREEHDLKECWTPVRGGLFTDKQRLTDCEAVVNGAGQMELVDTEYEPQWPNG